MSNTSNNANANIDPNTDANIDTETYIDDIVSKLSTENNLPVSKSDTRCAPGLKYEAGSCAKLVVLIEVAKAYNISVQPGDRIKLAPNFELLNPQKYKLYLVYQLHNRIGDKCTTQKCWTKQEFLRYMEEKAREEFLKQTFRPDSPQGNFRG